MRSTSLVTAAILAIALSGALIAYQSRAADHNDGPGAFTNNTLDITDVYAFRAPAPNDTNIVLVMNVNPLLTGSPTGSQFSANARYQIHIDGNDADLADNMTATFTFAGAGVGQTWRVEGLTPLASTGQVTYSGATPIVYDQGGIKIFAGLRDDPFFFDLGGFQAFLAAPHDFVPGNGLRPEGQLPVDFFEGKNVASIVVELPIRLLGVQPTSGVVRVWNSSSRPNLFSAHVRARVLRLSRGMHVGAAHSEKESRS